MSKELYSPEGLRLDGRRWNELKSFSIKVGTHPNAADGSLYVQQGNTKVMCLVEGPVEPRSRANMNPGKATVSVLLNIASFATLERRKRPKNDKRVKEMVTMLEKTFSEAVMCHLYPRTQILITCHVLAHDGGVLACATNAITLALVDAGIPLYDLVSAVNVGLYNNSVVLLDLNRLEENDMSFLTVGVIGGKVAMLLLEEKVPMDRLSDMVGMAVGGSSRVRELIEGVWGEGVRNELGL